MIKIKQDSMSNNFIKSKMRMIGNLNIELPIFRHIDNIPSVNYLGVDDYCRVKKPLMRLMESINHHTKEESSSADCFLYDIQTFHFNDTSDTSPLKSTVANNDNLFLRADGQNLSCMMKLINYKHPNYYRMIVDTVRNVVLNFHDFVIRQNSDFLSLEWFNKNNIDITWKAHYLSEDSLRFITLPSGLRT